VDLIAMQYARSKGLIVGGYCPLGRTNERGIIPDLFDLIETQSSNPKERTELNVVHSDGTLIISERDSFKGGTFYCYQVCMKYERPVFVVFLNEYKLSGKTEFNQWIRKNRIKTLNIAGNRASEVEGIDEKAEKILKVLL